ncbi:hypothetical protein TNCV_1854141 [Trichonephila clavipes]|nr:hypothetical protein TNCV_1854141 [Trichonephila clavipes]
MTPHSPTSHYANGRTHDRPSQDSNPRLYRNNANYKPAICDHHGTISAVALCGSLKNEEKEGRIAKKKIDNREKSPRHLQRAKLKKCNAVQTNLNLGIRQKGNPRSSRVDPKLPKFLSHRPPAMFFAFG